MSKFLLEIDQLDKVFKSDLLKANMHAVNGISCVFPEGEATAIIGHNGAGKTTTIRMILGLIKQDSGHIFFRGNPITTKDRALIGYMPEVHRLTGALTPEESLKIHLRFYSQIKRSDYKDLIEAALKRVGLLEHRKKLLRNLSKGLQRRLAFALSTIHRPKLLILDEPFTGLDPLAHGLMEKWISEEKQRGATILMSSHQVSSIVKTCDNFHVFQNGKVAYTSINKDGSSENTYGYTVELAGIDKPSLQDILNSNSLPAPIAWHSTDFQHTINFENYQDVSKVVAALLESGVVISSFGESSNITESLILSLLQKGEH